jgi:hypothetical protein
MQKRLVRWGGITFAGLVLLLLLIQAVPYGRDHSNPPLRQEPAWDSAATRALAADACFDCHSNQTNWPWYSNIAPISWFVQRDVDGGRDKMNFSEWDRPQHEVGELAENVRENEMPPSYYRWLHAKARLSSTEREALIKEFEAMFGTSATAAH